MNKNEMLQFIKDRTNQAANNADIERERLLHIAILLREKPQAFSDEDRKVKYEAVSKYFGRHMGGRTAENILATAQAAADHRPTLLANYESQQKELVSTTLAKENLQAIAVTQGGKTFMHEPTENLSSLGTLNLIVDLGKAADTNSVALAELDIHEKAHYETELFLSIRKMYEKPQIVMEYQIPGGRGDTNRHHEEPIEDFEGSPTEPPTEVIEGEEETASEDEHE